MIGGFKGEDDSVKVESTLTVRLWDPSLSHHQMYFMADGRQRLGEVRSHLHLVLYSDSLMYVWLH